MRMTRQLEQELTIVISPNWSMKFVFSCVPCVHLTLGTTQTRLISVTAKILGQPFSSGSKTDNAKGTLTFIRPNDGYFNFLLSSSLSNREKTKIWSPLILWLWKFPLVPPALLKPNGNKWRRTAETQVVYSLSGTKWFVDFSDNVQKSHNSYPKYILNVRNLSPA